MKIWNRYIYVFIPFRVHLQNSSDEETITLHSNIPMENVSRQSNVSFFGVCKFYLHTQFLHPAGRTLISDWFANSFVMVVYENLFFKIEE